MIEKRRRAHRSRGGGIDNRFQEGLPVGDAGGTATGSEGYKPSLSLAICILCG